MYWEEKDYEWLLETIEKKNITLFHNYLMWYCRKYKINEWDEVFYLLEEKEPQILLCETLEYVIEREEYEKCRVLNNLINEIDQLENNTKELNLPKKEKIDPWDIFKGL